MLEISCAFATSFDTPAHVVRAEELGYRRAWLYDSPALYPDVWASLALAAERTSRIGLGPGVLVPSLRHPMANAAAIGMLEHMAPGRIEVAIGSGFTGRMTLGHRALPWKFVREYVLALQGLLRGETVEWEGRKVRMMHPEGYAPERPVRVPMLLGTGGPKGNAAAKELADGTFCGGNIVPGAAEAGRCAVLSFGTVLGDGEDPGSERVVAAAGHAAAVALHGTYERGGDLSWLPGWQEWVAAIERVPEDERHLQVHDGHLIGVSDFDRPYINGDAVRKLGGARTADEWRERLAKLEEAGATEIAYQPAGPDIPGELERFAEVAGL